MADETPPQDDKCVPCDIAWTALIVFGVLTIAFIAADVFTQGKATEVVASAFSKMRPKLAVVQPIRSGDEQDAG